MFVVRPTSGGYVLGFRADPRERLRPLLTELKALHQAYTEKPIFGIEVTWNNEVITSMYFSCNYIINERKEPSK